MSDAKIETEVTAAIGRLYASAHVRVRKTGTIDGVEYFVVSLSGRGGRTGIVVRCPKCGRLGRLAIKRRSTIGMSFYVMHTKGDRDKWKNYCSIGSGDREARALEKIYRSEVMKRF